MIEHDEADHQDQYLGRLRYNLTEQPDAGLFVSDKELFRRLGVGPTTGRVAVRTLESQGFPRKQPLFGNRRYWPAVRHFLDGLYGLVKRGTAHDAPEGIPTRLQIRRGGRVDQSGSH
ncbi:MAG TPA: hypothetical protein VE999_10690 [Gemmataceae bacterium]|nr:hypothetical protein [Gemmataceae bacterium]